MLPFANAQEYAVESCKGLEIVNRHSPDKSMSFLKKLTATASSCNWNKFNPLSVQRTTTEQISYHDMSNFHFQHIDKYSSHWRYYVFGTLTQMIAEYLVRTRSGVLFVKTKCQRIDQNFSSIWCHKDWCHYQYILSNDVASHNAQFVFRIKNQVFKRVGNRFESRSG